MISTRDFILKSGWSEICVFHKDNGKNNKPTQFLCRSYTLNSNWITLIEPVVYGGKNVQDENVKELTRSLDPSNTSIIIRVFNPEDFLNLNAEGKI